MARKIVVTVIGKDQVGIVAKVATVLADAVVNIEDINQKILGGDIFAMTMLADMARSPLKLPELTAALEKALEGMGLKVMVQDAEVFRYMHRV
ncbi:MULTISPECIES: ACT domain-containing protein [Deferrisoma]